VSYRNHAAKPTAALWMLVAVADVALVLASAGTVALVALASVSAVTVAGIGTWRYLRREATTAPHRRRV
jgi:hypothetical protein